MVMTIPSIYVLSKRHLNDTRKGCDPEEVLVAKHHSLAAITLPKSILLGNL